MRTEHSTTADAAATRLVGDLEAIYAAEPPATLRCAIDRLCAAPQQATTTSRPRGMPRLAGPARRLSPVVAMVLAAVVIGGSVVAVAPFRNRAFQADPGVAYVMQAGLGVAIGQSATVDGYTVTIDSAYADGNRVVIGYSIDPGPHDVVDVLLHQPALTTADGRRLRGRGTLGAEVVDGAADSLVWFDAPQPASSQDWLGLRLTVDTLLVSEVDAGALERAIPGGIFERLPGDWTTLREVALSRALVFELGLPVQPTRIIDFGIPATANGVTVVLERVVVAPSETVVWLRGIDAAGMATLTTPGADGRARIANAWTTDDGLLALEFTEPLSGRAGAWTLRVEPRLLLDGDALVGPGEEPWRWTFELP